MSGGPLLKYYQDNLINPVPIEVEDEACWKIHFARRLNLYQCHLGIPLSLLRNRSVLEFGCNSGENSLVLASFGANLTLVEPNHQVLPRLKMLFKRFGLEKRMVSLLQQDMDSFNSSKRYDLVIAEGFLSCLPNRDNLISKISGLLLPRGLAVISFIDRYGFLLELTKKMLLWRVYQLAKVDDIYNSASLEFARQLYEEDFLRLNYSRPFESWWKDNLVNPLFRFDSCWSYREILALIEKEGSGFYSSSPRWSSTDHFIWYKNILDTNTRHRKLLKEWANLFCFFLTGFVPSPLPGKPVPPEVVNSVSCLAEQISEYTEAPSLSIEKIEYPLALDRYLQGNKDPRILRFNSELKELYNAVKTLGVKELISAYKKSKCLKGLWGVPYHYLCFTKEGLER